MRAGLRDRLYPSLSVIDLALAAYDPLRAGQSHQGIINSLIQIKSIIFLMVMSEQSHQD